MAVRLHSVTAHVAPHAIPLAEVEQRVADASPGFAVPRGALGRITGVRRIHHAPDGTQTSDLAAQAARRSLDDAGLSPTDLDLLIFASASQDMIEPATAHIVAHKLGAHCPVMDVKNACNSWLNGVQVAEAMVALGTYRRVLVCTGEMPSLATRWQVRDFAQFLESAPGYTMSDSGAAGLVEACAPGDSGEILHRWFTAESGHWDVGRLPTGGSFSPRDPDTTYFKMDGARLRKAFDSIDPASVHRALADDGLALDDFSRVAVHQVAMGYLDDFAAKLGLDRSRVVESLPEHGNCAAASLPLQWRLLREEGSMADGDLLLLVGLAGGISAGTMAVRW